MPDEPEIKEQDPVAAIREALNRALGLLRKLLGQEEEELQEEMQEVEGTSQQPQGKGVVSGKPAVTQPQVLQKTQTASSSLGQAQVNPADDQQAGDKTSDQDNSS